MLIPRQFAAEWFIGTALMRLTEKQIAIITELVSKHFGEDAAVLLFGSRVDDAARGGDIDLLIETDYPQKEALKAKMALNAGLQKRLGEQRIDIVVHQNDSPLQPVHKEALRTGVRLK